MVEKDEDTSNIATLGNLHLFFLHRLGDEAVQLNASLLQHFVQDASPPHGMAELKGAISHSVNRSSRVPSRAQAEVRQKGQIVVVIVKYILKDDKLIDCSLKRFLYLVFGQLRVYSDHVIVGKRFAQNSTRLQNFTHRSAKRIKSI
jgi:hypothetical protein